MKKIFLVVCLVVSSSVILFFALWWLDSYKATFRYRMTVEVNVNDVLKVGSGVVEIQWTIPPRALQGIAYNNAIIKAQAVLVDLGDGDALLASPAGSEDGTAFRYMFFRAYSGQAGLPDKDLNRSGFPITKKTLEILSRIKFPATLQENNRPSFYYIKDKNVSFLK